MEPIEREFCYYTTPSGRCPFSEWLESLKDREAQDAIHYRLARFRRGLWGDCKPVGAGVWEARFFIGPGYRIYFAIHKNVLIVLLNGGVKDSQPKDIIQAITSWEDFKWKNP